MQHLNNIALILRGWKNALLVKYPTLNIVYSSDMAYEGDTVEMRGEHVLKTDVKESFNLFAFKRAPLTWTTDHRAAKIDSKEYLNSQFKLYKAWYGQLAIDFMFYAPNPKYNDEFEIKYHVEDGISDIDEFYVDLTNIGLGTWKYQCIWHTELTSLDIHYKDVYYKALGGKLTINGIYLLLEADAKRIETINFDIFSYTDLCLPTNPLLGSEVIT